MPAPFRSQGAGRTFYLQKRLRRRLTRAITYWPDRLASVRWQKRCRVEGLAHLRTAQEDGAPVILATLHFGPLRLLRYLLRAQGLAVATLVQEPRDKRSRLQRMKDARIAVPGVPDVFTLQELRQAHEFLKGGRALLVAVDALRGRQVPVFTAHGTLRLATGAIRLAQATGARLVPCLIEEEAPWRFVVHFGKWASPPAGRDEVELEAVAAHLLHEFLPTVCARPGQWGPSFMAWWQTGREVPAGDESAVSVS